MAKTALDSEQPTMTDPSVMMAMLERMTAAMELLAKRPETAASDIGSVNQAIKDVVTELSKQNSRHVMPSNARNEDARSSFRPKGEYHEDYEGLKWHRQPWFNGHRVQLEEVTPDEIAAYNELSGLLSSYTSQRLARGGKWRAWVGPNNNDMYLSIPCKTIEDQAELPATLVFILQEFINGNKIDPASLYSEVAMLKAQLELLQSKTVGVGV